MSYSRVWVVFDWDEVGGPLERLEQQVEVVTDLHHHLELDTRFGKIARKPGGIRIGDLPVHDLRPDREDTGAHIGLL